MASSVNIFFGLLSCSRAQRLGFVFDLPQLPDVSKNPLLLIGGVNPPVDSHAPRGGDALPA